MRHSKTIVSNILSDLLEMDDNINNTLLIGDQIELIHEAGRLYNRLRGLITKDYFLQEEYEWIVALGNRWNELCMSYVAEVGDEDEVSEGVDGIKDLLEGLFDDIRNREDDLENM